MKRLLITVLKEYYVETVKDCYEMGIDVIQHSSSEDYEILTLEGSDEAIDMMEDFMNGESFI